MVNSKKERSGSMEQDGRFGPMLMNLKKYLLGLHSLLHSMPRFSATQKEGRKVVFVECLQYTKHFTTVFYLIPSTNFQDSCCCLHLNMRQLRPGNCQVQGYSNSG